MKLCATWWSWMKMISMERSVNWHHFHTETPATNLCSSENYPSTRLIIIPKYKNKLLFDQFLIDTQNSWIKTTDHIHWRREDHSGARNWARARYPVAFRSRGTWWRSWKSWRPCSWGGLRESRCTSAPPRLLVRPPPAWRTGPLLDSIH